MLDEDEKKQIKEHIRTLEYVYDELIIQRKELNKRLLNLFNRIEQEKEKLKND